MTGSIQPLTISNGQSLSSVLRIDPGEIVVGLDMPAAWTVAGITFQASVDGVVFNNVVKADGTEYSLVAVAGTHIKLPTDALMGITYLKVRSGTSATPVNQVVDRALTLVKVA